MQTQNLMADPFAMMISPEAVLAAIESSDRLKHLKRRVCRPLDRPLIPHRADVDDYDRAIDDEPEAAADLASEPGNDAEV